MLAGGGVGPPQRGFVLAGGGFGPPQLRATPSTYFGWSHRSEGASLSWDEDAAPVSETAPAFLVMCGASRTDALLALCDVFVPCCICSVFSCRTAHRCAIECLWEGLLAMGRV